MANAICKRMHQMVGQHPTRTKLNNGAKKCTSRFSEICGTQSLVDHALAAAAAAAAAAVACNHAMQCNAMQCNANVLCRVLFAVIE